MVRARIKESSGGEHLTELNDQFVTGGQGRMVDVLQRHSKVDSYLGWVRIMNKLDGIDHATLCMRRGQYEGGYDGL